MNARASLPRARRTGPLRTKARRAKALAGCAALALLAGCAQPVPQASPDPVPPVPPPVVGQVQQKRIMASLAKEMKAADKAKSIAPVKDRLSEPAASMRSAQYQAAKKKIPDAIVPLGFDEVGSIVATSDSWPRDYFVVSDPPKGTQSYRIYVLTQDSAQDNYKLWGWIRPFGGATLPRTVDPEIGSLPLADDDDSLKVSPKSTVVQYVDLLNKGKGSKYAKNFAKTDELRQLEASELKQWADAVKAVGGKAGWQHKVGKWGVHALQTGDGGALVAASATASLSVTLKEGSMAPGKLVAAFAGRDKFVKGLQLDYTMTLLFWVPGAGSKDPIQVLGAERVMTAASGK